MNAMDQWLWDALSGLANVSMNAEGCALLKQADIAFVSRSDIDNRAGEPVILMPIDGEPPAAPYTPITARFGSSTAINVYDRVAQPKGWSGVPNDESALWWRSASGALTPAWNMWGVLRHLLSLSEEAETESRDGHGRYALESSPRDAAGLAHVPIVNNALALLVDAAAHLRNPDHTLLSGIGEYVLPPAIVLSHDLDNLTGNTLWTQIGRASRFAKLLSRGKLAAFKQLKFAASNLMSPLKYYFDDQTGMWEQQQKHGFNSVSYVLNGEGGRFGARTPFSLSKKLIDLTPESMETGMHYNYAHVRDPAKFAAQKAEIDGALDAPCTSGRAHYLCFDPLKDFPILIQHGIAVDESVGWPYRNSYRVGIAGPFAPFDEKTGEAMPILELPMTFMDSDLHREDGSDDTFSAMLDHICAVGGCLSILVHPGASNSPERPEMSGVYERCLGALSQREARSFTPMQLRQLWRDGPTR